MSTNDKIMLSEPRQPPFPSVRASCKNGWKRTGSLRIMSPSPSSPDLNSLSRLGHQAGKVS